MVWVLVVCLSKCAVGRVIWWGMESWGLSTVQQNGFVKIANADETLFYWFYILIEPPSVYCRDSIGGSVVVGDTRWAGSFGVNADFVARTHCSIEIITSEDIEVIGWTANLSLAPPPDYILSRLRVYRRRKYGEFAINRMKMGVECIARVCV